MTTTSSSATSADPADFAAVQVHETDDRLHAAIRRPETRNAIDAALVDELHRLCDHLERNPKILILSGTEIDGRGFFASGADIAELRERRREDALRGINSGVFERIARLPMPVIAALDGYALGGGAELAWAADFRVATTRVRIGQPEVGLGILPAAGALWRIAELAGLDTARRLVLAGHSLTADEALARGLVTSLHEPAELLDAADALADDIARQDPLAVRLGKQLLAMPRDAHPAVDNIAQAILFESDAKFERMQSFLDRRNTRGDRA
ncbi:enoyl-CoA hydratase/isomerase family protein [Microbacterium aureliae]